MKQFIKTLLVLLLGLFSCSLPALADDFSVAANHAIAVDIPSGKILYEKQAETPVPVASITKLLTVYLVYEAIQKGELSLNELIDIGDYPYSLTTTAASNVNLDARRYTVSDLLNASLITSANSATIALAEKVAGSEPAFVDKMKAKLTQWGISDAKLVNVTGLNNSYLGDHLYPGSSKDDENLLSALDVAIIARRLVVDYPQVLEITSQYSYFFAGTLYYSTNQMLPNGTYARAGVTGLKTGTTEKIGNSFVATIQQNKMNILTVVLDVQDSQEFPDNRFSATNELMNYVFNTFSLTTLVEKGEPYQTSSIDVFNGKSKKVDAVATKDLTVVTRKNAQKGVSATFSPQDTNLDAPVAKNQPLGRLTLVDKDLIGKGYLEEQPHVDMMAAKDIQTADWPQSWWNHFVRYVNERL